MDFFSKGGLNLNPGRFNTPQDGKHFSTLIKIKCQKVSDFVLNVNDLVQRAIELKGLEPLKFIRDAVLVNKTIIT